MPQGVITVYGFFTPLRTATKLFAANQIAAHELGGAGAKPRGFRTSIYLLFIDLP
jgi:hypothetical protein